MQHMVYVGIKWIYFSALSWLWILIKMAKSKKRKNPNNAAAWGQMEHDAARER